MATQVKNIRHQPSFRWIHLPANNIAWVETLLAKAFIEGGHKDIEDFKAVEKCFNQEHRGGEAHAHFMRPWSQRYAISPRRMEKAPDPPVDPPTPPARVPRNFLSTRTGVLPKMLLATAAFVGLVSTVSTVSALNNGVGRLPSE